jgi:sigma-B regulation protein RsbU (phosphoserine phosphatase)
LICDVVGHSLRGALVTSVTRALLEELRPMMHNAGRFLGALNLRLRAVFERVEEPFLATAFYLIADNSSKEVSFANAGHPDPLRLRRQP